MTSLTKYFANATAMVENPVEYANQMAIVKLIRSAESRFDALNEACNTTSDDKFYGQKGFRLVEMRDDSLIGERNHAGIYACKIILALNTEVKAATGKPFLRRRYDLGIRFNQNDCSELELLMADFDDCFDEAVIELAKSRVA